MNDDIAYKLAARVASIDVTHQPMPTRAKLGFVSATDTQKKAV